MSESIKEYTVVLGFGAVLYSLIEVVFRGYTHWTMTVTGGITFLAIYLLYTRVPMENIFLRSLAGCAIITLIEFGVGCIVNRWLGWQVWDYSAHYFNVLGQICPLFSAIWFALCIPAYWLCLVLQSSLNTPGVN